MLPWPKNELTVSMRLEVCSHSTKEGFAAEMVTQHPDDRTSLEVANVIKDLVHFQGVLDGNFDRMRGTQ